VLTEEASDGPARCRLYTQRIAIAEPVFANIRHNKGPDRFTAMRIEGDKTSYRLEGFFSSDLRNALASESDNR
jgi:hypothetical protein